MHPDLVKLLELQEKDLALLEVDARLAGVLAEIERLDAALRQAAAAAQAARGAVRDASQRQEELEAKIESYRRLQERRRQRLEVSRPGKETPGLVAELDLSRSVLAREESEWVKAGELVGELASAAEKSERAVEEARQDQASERAELERRRAEVDAARVAALEAREAVASQIDKSLRNRYDRLRTTRSPRPVVALNGSACGACYTTIPLNRRSQIRAGEKVDWCEACGVILYAAD